MKGESRILDQDKSNTLHQFKSESRHCPANGRSTCVTQKSFVLTRIRIEIDDLTTHKYSSIGLLISICLKKVNQTQACSNLNLKRVAGPNEGSSK